MQNDNLEEKIKFQGQLASLDDDEESMTQPNSYQSLLNSRPASSRRKRKHSPDSISSDLTQSHSRTAEVGPNKRIALARVASPQRSRTAPSLPSVGCGPPSGHSNAEVIACDGVADTPKRPTGQRPHLAQRAETMPSNMPSYLPPFTGALPRGTNKRKRATINMVPEGRRIFTGLVFFYVRNNDMNGARRHRICRAIEYGALWANEWHRAVTHIIADQDLNYADVQIELRNHSLTEVPPGVILVNEKYASDCIEFRHLLNPRQHMYDVPGYIKQHNPKSAQMPTSDALSQSLQLKKAHGKDALGAGAAEPNTDSRIHSFSSSPLPVLEPTDQEHRNSQNPPTDRDSPRDELDDMIDSVKTTEGFSLDSDEDKSQQTIVEETSSESEDESVGEQPPSQCKSRLIKPAAGFQCLQKPGDVVTSNPNQEVIDVLQQMATYYDSTNDTWRTLSYRKAIATLRRTNQRIMTSAEAMLLPAIGKRLADKIEEIAVTHRLRRLDATHEDPTDITLRKFLAIYGVGTQQAMRWYQQGYRSVEDLLAKVSLTASQRIGIAHMDDFAARISRAEVTRLGGIVTSALHNIDPTFQVTIGGSYRRGAASSGDIDLIITRPDTALAHIRTVVLESLIPRLFGQGFLTAALAATNRDTGTKWHGACQLPGARPSPVTSVLDGLTSTNPAARQATNPNPWRRIDFLLVPWNEVGAAMIYFTGNDIFNRSMRLLARKRGMCLNQRGLFKNVLRGAGQVKLAEGELVESSDERRIFDILGVPWRTPAERQI